MKKQLENLFFNLSWKTGERRAVPIDNKEAMNWAEENGLAEFVSQLGGLLYYRRTSKELNEVNEIAQ
jgi:hypothetical protein